MTIELPVVVLRLKVLVQFIERYFVGRFEFLIVLSLALNGIVCKMDEFWGVLVRKFLGTSANIALLIPPNLSAAPNDPHSDIEFTVIVEKGVNVFLDNVSHPLPIRMQFLLSKLWKQALFVCVDGDPLPPVCVLPGLQYPWALWDFHKNIPKISFTAVSFFLFSCFTELLLSYKVEMISCWNYLVDILIEKLSIFIHKVQQAFFVTNRPWILDMVMQPDFRRVQFPRFFRLIVFPIGG